MKKLLFPIVSRIRDTVSLKILNRRSSIGHVCKHLKRIGFMPGTIIDVGVASGTPGLYHHFPNSYLLLVEPLHEYSKPIENILKQRSGSHLPVAAYHTNTTLSLNVHSAHLEGSSLMRESMGSEYDGVPRPVRALRLDEYIQSTTLPKPYLLKIDVQGSEIDVLSGCSNILQDIDFIILEASLFKFMNGSPELTTLLLSLQNLGFSPYDIIHGWYRPLDNALGQVDIVFAQTDGHYRSDHRYALPHQYRSRHL